MRIPPVQDYVCYSAVNVHVKLIEAAEDRLISI